MFLQLIEVINELKIIQAKLDALTEKVKDMYKQIYGGNDDD